MIYGSSKTFNILFNHCRHHLHKHYMWNFPDFFYGKRTEFFEDLDLFLVMHAFFVRDCNNHIPVWKIFSEEHRARRHSAGSRRKESSFILKFMPSVNNKTTFFKSGCPNAWGSSSFYCIWEFPNTFSKSVKFIYCGSSSQGRLGSGSKAYMCRECLFYINPYSFSFRQYSLGGFFHPVSKSLQPFYSDTFGFFCFNFYVWRGKSQACSSIHPSYLSIHINECHMKPARGGYFYHVQYNPVYGRYYY